MSSENRSQYLESKLRHARRLVGALLAILAVGVAAAACPPLGGITCRGLTVQDACGCVVARLDDCGDVDVTGKLLIKGTDVRDNLVSLQQQMNAAYTALRSAEGGLLDRISSLKQTVADHDAVLRTIDGGKLADFNRMQKRLADNEAEFDKLKKSVATLESLAKLEPELAKKISELDRKLLIISNAEMTGGNATTEKQVKDLATANATIEKQVKELAAANATTEKQFKDLATAQQKTTTEVQLLEQNVGRLNKETKEIKERAADSEQRTTDRLLALAKQAGEKKTDEGLAKKIDDSVRALDTSVTALDKKVGELEKKVDASEQRSTAGFLAVTRKLENDIATASQHVTALHKHLHALKDQDQKIQIRHFSVQPKDGRQQHVVDFGEQVSEAHALIEGIQLWTTTETKPGADQMFKARVIQVEGSRVTVDVFSFGNGTRNGSTIEVLVIGRLR